MTAAGPVLPMLITAALLAAGLAVSQVGPTTPLLAGAAVLACAALAVRGRRNFFDPANDDHAGDEHAGERR